MNYNYAMVGSPQIPDYEWSDRVMERLTSLGFGGVQLNVAWGCRPGDEALNIEDVLVLDGQSEEVRARCVKRRDDIRKRLSLCKKHGLRSLFHFGAPYNGSEGYLSLPLKACILDEAVISKYEALLFELERQIPEIDDILIYTYDQDAWLCDEFRNCPACRGIPLDKRLVPFLERLTSARRKINPDGILWWEPWELSAGQVLKCVPELPDQNFGLMLHSNTGEVQKARPVDLWFRNTVRLASERNIPVVAELFLAEICEETQPLMRIPAPGLSYFQIKAVQGVRGVCGIKEYFGLHPLENDPCLEAAGLCLNHPEMPLDEVLLKVADKYGDRELSLRLFKETEDAYMLYPWDVSWYAREIGNSTVDHGWSAAFIRGQQCSTPSWDSSRHAIFMKTDDSQPHPWMLEDIQLRCGMCADALEKAVKTADELLRKSYSKEASEARESLEYFKRIARSYELHLRETNVAMMLREAEEGELKERLKKEMKELLQSDLVNQNGSPKIMKIIEEFDDSADEWLEKYLVFTNALPMEKGYFALTTR